MRLPSEEPVGIFAEAGPTMKLISSGSGKLQPSLARPQLAYPQAS